MDGTKEDGKLSYVDPITFAQELDKLAKEITRYFYLCGACGLRGRAPAYRFWSRRRYAFHGAPARLPIASPRYAAPAKVRYRHWSKAKHKEVTKHHANFIQ